MSERSLFIEAFGDHPKIRIIDFFLDNKIFDFSKKEIVEGTGMSKATFYKYFPDLEEKKLVKLSRKFGKTKLYKLNKKNPVVKKVIELDKKLTLTYADKITEKALA